MGQIAPALVRLEGFEVDLRSREILKNGVPLAVRERPFQLLEILLASAGQVVTRDELSAALWPTATFVTFNRSVNTAMNKLRSALGDSAERPKFIETIGRRGYRLIAIPDIQPPPETQPTTRIIVLRFEMLRRVQPSSTIRGFTLCAILSDLPRSSARHASATTLRRLSGRMGSSRRQLMSAAPLHT